MIAMWSFSKQMFHLFWFVWLLSLLFVSRMDNSNETFCAKAKQLTFLLAERELTQWREDEKQTIFWHENVLRIWLTAMSSVFLLLLLIGTIRVYAINEPQICGLICRKKVRRAWVRRKIERGRRREEEKGAARQKDRGSVCGKRNQGNRQCCWILWQLLSTNARFGYIFPGTSINIANNRPNCVFNWYLPFLKEAKKRCLDY